jgi:hypothetical protein
MPVPVAVKLAMVGAVVSIWRVPVGLPTEARLLVVRLLPARSLMVPLTPEVVRSAAVSPVPTV